MIGTAALHVVALAIVIVKPSTWLFVIAALVANHLVIVTASLLPRCALLGPNTRRIADARDVVALTFDDGPDPVVTPAVLDLLEKANAKATFFCIGRKAEAHPDVVAAIRGRGHDVQNHSYTHPNLFALHSPRSMEREITSAQLAIERSGAPPKLFRAPAGIQNPWLFPVLKRTGLSLVSWTRRGFDTTTRDASRVAARLLRGLRAGDILLLHDGSSARDRNGQPVVLDALTRVLAAMQQNGLRAERLDVMMKRTE